jgi:hypothetical protein
MPRVRFVLPIAALALAASAVAALAATDSLVLTGPHTNRLGQNFNYSIDGYAGPQANRVIAWEQFYRRSGCATTYTAESARVHQSALYGLTQWIDAAVSPDSTYSLIARFGARNAGQHGICAYLINSSTGQTYAHDGAWWVNVASSGGGSGTGTAGTLKPAPVGSGQCQAARLAGGSVYAQIAVSGTSCATAAAVATGAAAARGAAYTADGFSCKATAEGAGSQWSSAWGGTYYAYSCAMGSAQVAFNWGTDYTY